MADFGITLLMSAYRADLDGVPIPPVDMFTRQDLRDYCFPRHSPRLLVKRYIPTRKKSRLFITDSGKRYVDAHKEDWPLSLVGPGFSSKGNRMKFVPVTENTEVNLELVEMVKSPPNGYNIGGVICPAMLYFSAWIHGERRQEVHEEFWPAVQKALSRLDGT